MLKAAPALAIAILVGPVLFGLAATVLPAFGWFPALGGERLSLDPWRELLREPGLATSVALSLACGIVVTAAALGTVLVFVAGWSHTRAFQLLQHMLSPLLAVPHAAAALGLAFLLAPSGWLMRLASPELTGFTRPPDWLIVNDPLGLSLMAGLFAKELPFLFLVTLAALPQARPGPHGAVAASLGYGRIAGFLHTVWPLVYPQIRLAVFAVIAYSSSVVDMAAILGPTNPAPLAMRLVGWMNDPDLAVRFKASAGAVLQLGVSAAAILAWIALERLAGAAMAGLRGSGLRLLRDGPVRAAGAIAVSLSAGLVFCGLFVLALWSLAGNWSFPDAFPDRMGPQNWIRHSGALGWPLAVTLLAGLASTALAAVLVLASLENESRAGTPASRRALAILYLPLIVPQASFVFGLQLFFLVAGMDASFAALVMVHLVFVLPYVFLSLSDPWRAHDPRYARTARALGASDARIFWRLRLPMLLRPVLAACAVGFAVSVGQYLPTLLIGAGRWPTVTTEAVALASGGDRRLVAIYAFMQLLLPFLGFVLATIVPALVHSGRRGMRASA